MSCRDLSAIAAHLPRSARHRLSVPRPNHCGYALRSHLSGQEKNQFQHGLWRASRRDERRARRYLAGEFYGLRSRILRSGDSSARTAGKSVRPKSVTCVRGSKGHTVIAADVCWQAALLKKPLKRSKSIVFSGRGKSLTGEQETAGMVSDRQRIAILTVS